MQTFVVPYTLWTGLPGHRVKFVCLCVLIAAQIFEQNSSSLYVYVLLVRVPSAAATVLLGTAMRSSFTDVIPPEHIGKALGSLNILSALIGSVSPLYGAFCFDYFGSARVKGYVCAAHYAVILVFIFYSDFQSNYWDVPAVKGRHGSFSNRSEMQSSQILRTGKGMQKGKQKMNPKNKIE